jgi:hypothetical protein
MKNVTVSQRVITAFFKYLSTDCRGNGPDCAMTQGEVKLGEILTYSRWENLGNFNMALRNDKLPPKIIIHE